VLVSKREHDRVNDDDPEEKLGDRNPPRVLQDAIDERLRGAPQNDRHKRQPRKNPWNRIPDVSFLRSAHKLHL
jgi:hypothetical protein